MATEMSMQQELAREGHCKSGWFL